MTKDLLPLKRMPVALAMADEELSKIMLVQDQIPAEHVAIPGGRDEFTMRTFTFYRLESSETERNELVARSGSCRG